MKLRTTCKICNKPLKKRQRLFCCKEHRYKDQNQRYKKKQADWQRDRDDKLASIPSPDKIQCLICGRYYVQLGSHVVQRHQMTAREYREHFDLEVKKGLTPEWFHRLKGDIAIKNETFRNLISGKKFWFKKGSTTAGRYKRSHITLQTLSTLYKKTRQYIKYEKNKRL